MRGFGELESKIMERLRARIAPATVSDIVDELRTDRVIAYAIWPELDQMSTMDMIAAHTQRRRPGERSERHSPRRPQERGSIAR